LSYHKVDPANPEHVAAWTHWATWKLGFMDAAWQDARFGVTYVRPGYLSLTQSQYGWMAFTDGYYFNVTRSLPVVVGHGGYHDYWLGLFNPSFFLEMGRARDVNRPCWYMPCWYNGTTPDQFRAEQYLSFQTNIQGMATPPPLCPAGNPNCSAFDGIVESNKLMARLGTVFTTMPVTRPPVALLYSISHLINAQAKDRKINYGAGDAHGAGITFAYLAGKLLQHQFMAVVDEDVVDGTLAANHKALLLVAIDYLAPEVKAAVEDFVRQGGLVMQTGDCELKIGGAVDLGVVPGLPEANVKKAETVKADMAKLDEAMKPLSEELDPSRRKLQDPKLSQEEKDKVKKDMGPTEAKLKELADKRHQLALEVRDLTSLRAFIQGVQPLAKEVGTQLEKAGIRPVFECDGEGIVATRQASGDIEYLFAVNATHDPKGDSMASVMAAEATIGLPADGRPVYDAIKGSEAAGFKKQGSNLEAKLRFGPGAMRVFARTTRPIGGVRVGSPVLRRDTTVENMPIALQVTATVLDSQGSLLNGSAPLRIVVRDSLGAVRYDLYRATEQGALKLEVPLAANDPAGEWRITVQELLANNEASAGFAYAPATRCASLAGSVRRAVFFADDYENVFRFFRLHRDVAVVKGDSEFNGAAAERLAAVLKPWGVRCTVVNAADATKPRAVSEEEALTLCGLYHTGKGSIKAGDANPAVQVGYALESPALLLGTPEDNPLIQHLQKESFLPYRASKGVFPGPGRGYLAWQRDGLGARQETITLIAYDAQGMSEAVGTLYELAAGMKPLTPFGLAERHSVRPAAKSDALPELKVAWAVVLPDKVDAMKVDGGISAVTHDGSLATIDAGGALKSAKELGDKQAKARIEEFRAAEQKLAKEVADRLSLPGRMFRKAATGAGRVAVGYVGGLVRVVDPDGKAKAAKQFDADVTALAWLGDTLVVALSDDRVVGLKMP
jgi:hypothetical protein